MNYHLIRTDDMLNGEGLRVVVFLSGCNHHCFGCHNPETWDENRGYLFTGEEVSKIINELNKEYISGITFSGGEPLHESNARVVFNLIQIIKAKYPTKTIWLYTGYDWEYIFSNAPDILKDIVSLCDVVCDGKFIKSLEDINCHWVGSTNQRVIDVKMSLKSDRVIERKTVCYDRR